jgi:hypothetical protein
VPVGFVDAHYTLHRGSALVQSPVSSSDPLTNWVTTPVAQWIGPTSDHRNVDDTTLYDYSTRFSLPPDANPATVSLTLTLASDNNVYLFVNGRDTGLPRSQSQFLAFTTFTVDASGSPYFRTGTNTLTFAVENGPGLGPSPTGLLVTSISGTFGAVPEPPAAVLYLTAVPPALGLWWHRRRRAAAGEPDGVDGPDPTAVSLRELSGSDTGASS